ncbi:glycosyltransferase [uncultured Maribacter sp.]|uniref:glycosyltransferase n=1 Tax=uncultured Maribacter sp. TaxID=431308 RepID=UPI002625DB20|nr:glycosyltransferase [uncultured Maribacter sp.]
MNIIYVGANGFPFGMATIQRQLLIAKGFVLQGNTCLVLSRFGVQENKKIIKRKGKVEGVHYLCSSPVAYRPSNFILRSGNKVLGTFLETYYIIKNRKLKTKNILFTVRTSLYSTLYYRGLSYILGYKYIGDINEALGATKDASVNDKFFDKYGQFLYDGVLLISDSLMNSYKSKIPKLKIPVICDIAKLDEIDAVNLREKSLLYCASAAYLDTLKFVIEVFEKITRELNLILVVSGSEVQMKTVKELIQKSTKRNYIHLKSRIPYNELIGLYKGADLLLIPLPEIEQHKARFPHKIAEYTACNTPFISNNWGEVSNYFSKDNCFLINSYNVNDYVDKINNITFEKAKEISDRAYKVSKNNFDYKVLSLKIHNFLKEI